MTLPLDGITVLDFSTLLPGPLATLMLAEAGARVVKVERPEGEDMRRFPPLDGDGASAPFAALNAGKAGVALDLRSTEGLAAARALVAGADVLVEGFRPGVMDRLGLGYAAARALNPRLVYCSISGYGAAGPRSGEAGHDVNYQARAGLLSLGPGIPGSPAVPAALVADIAGGAMPAVINVLLALRRRDLTGEGCHLDVAMADAGFTFAWYALAEGFASGRFPGANENRLAGGSPRYGLYATADDRFLAVGALEDKFWAAFCAAIELPEGLRDDARDPVATRAGVAARVRAHPLDAWEPVLAAADCCATPVATLTEAVADPHFAARGLLAARAGLGAGAVPLVPLPLAPVLRRPPDVPRPVPALAPAGPGPAGEETGEAGARAAAPGVSDGSSGPASAVRPGGTLRGSSG